MSRTRIRRLFARPASARRAARFRPTPEALEERIALAHFVLSTLADDGSVGSLRGAIIESNLTPEADTITVPYTIFPSFELPVIRLNGSQLPTVTGSTSIRGESVFGFSGEQVLHISGNFNSRVFQVGTTGNLALTNLTIVDGSTDEDGGGILNQGTLALERVTISGNSAASGGGIASTGPSLTVVDSTISHNTAQVRGGGVVTSSAIAVFTGTHIVSNTVRGADNLTVSATVIPIGNQGGTAEGGGLAILNGVVVIGSSTISDNLAQGGKGGPGRDGTGGLNWSSDAAFGEVGKPGGTGGDGFAAGGGGTAYGGGIWIDRGLLGIQASTMSGNRAAGGEGGDGGRGGAGGNAQNGGAAPPPTGFLNSGGDGGVGGQGGAGGAGGTGGQAYGGGLYLGFDSGSISFINSTIAGNQAIGGRGGRSGSGGAGGAGGQGGQGNALDGSGTGGRGGNGGNGGATGVTGAAFGGGAWFNPAMSERSLTSSTVAYNDASAGPAGAAGTGGAAGIGGSSPFGPSRHGAAGSPGGNGTIGAAGSAQGGGLIHLDVAFGTENFRLRLRNTIVATNTVNFANASDIDGTLRTPADSVANLVGTGGSGGLINGQAGNQVGVGNPGLRPLGHYGGPTQTVALTSASPAVDAGDNGEASGSGLTTDQRGAGFARISRGQTDIGAFELQESYIVTTLHDENDGESDPGIGQGTSLREAVALASRAGTPQTITFAPGLAGTLVLTLGQIGITTSLTIDGPGARVLAIDAGMSSRAFQITYSDSPYDVTIRGLTITRGSAGTLEGGAISSFGKLTLDSVYIHHSSASRGGGIFAAGPLTVINSTIANNTALTDGGGIYAFSADLTLVNSTIAGNQAQQAGGGILSISVSPSQTTLINVTLATNQAANGSGFSGRTGTSTPYSLTLQNTICTDSVHGNVLVTRLGGNLDGGNPKLGPLADNGGPVPVSTRMPWTTEARC